MAKSLGGGYSSGQISQGGVFWPISNLRGGYFGYTPTWPSLYLLYIIVLILQFYILLTVYFDSKTLLSLFKIIFWIIIYSLYLIQNCGLLFVGFIGIFQSALYLNYKFNEINRNLQIAFKTFDNNLLLKVMKEHNYIERMNKKLNYTYRYIIFILYYIATPGFEMVLYCVHDKRQTFIGKLFTAFIFTSCFTAVFIMTMISAGISRASHKSYPILFSYLNRNRIQLRTKLKIMLFIEKLSGPDIGFYCYNLFPMNSYEFYQFIYICGVNYVLIINFF